MHFEYLKRRIIKSRSELKNLKENESSDGILLADIDVIRNSIFDILDHSINHFSNKTINRSDIYFPIICINQGVDDLRKNAHYLKIKKFIGEDACKFLESAYEINKKYDNCLNLLKSSSKHKIIDKISKTKRDVLVKYRDFGDHQTKKDIYGNLNFMRGLGNTSMFDCVILSPKGVTIVESLETVRAKGNSLIIKKNDQEIEVWIKPFLEKCLDCTEEIINLWNTYNEK